MPAAGGESIFIARRSGILKQRGTAAMIKLKPNVLEKVQTLLANGEEIQVAIAYGKTSYSPEVRIQPKDRDYLLITNNRLMIIKGHWFETGFGVSSYSRDSVCGVSVASFLIGCTVTINMENAEGTASQLMLTNCGKPEAEAIQKSFSEQQDGRRCPACHKSLRADFAFCPFCQATLKHICPACRKPMDKDWVSCPFCGK